MRWRSAFPFWEKKTNLPKIKITAISAVIRHKTLRKEVAAKSTVKPMTPVMVAIMARMSIYFFKVCEF